MKKLYLKSYQFNMYLFINEIRKEIEKKGGEIVDSYPYILKQEKTMIFNRTFLEAKREIDENKEKIEKSERLQAYYKKYYKNYYDALKRNYTYKRIVKNTGYLHFALNGFIYYLQFDENPFFDHFIIKEKAEKINNEYITRFNHYLDKIDLPNFDVCSYISLKNIKKFVKDFINKLEERKESEKVKTRKKVYNLYNNGWHYETITEEKKKTYKKIEEI